MCKYLHSAPHGTQEHRQMPFQILLDVILGVRRLRSPRSKSRSVPRRLPQRPIL